MGMSAFFSEYKDIIITAFVVMILLTGGLYYLSNSDFMDLEGNAFCSNKGFDGVSLTGTYSEKYRKVNCVSCYNLNCIYEEFKVIKKFGIIVEAEN